MPANHKVSVAWQIVATFVPIANFWAFYRIRKLRRYLLYVYVPAIVVSVPYYWYYYTLGYEKFGSDRAAFADSVLPAQFNEPNYFDYYDPVGFWISIAISVVLQGLSIYLAVVWSRQHNRRFDSPQQPATT